MKGQAICTVNVCIGIQGQCRQTTFLCALSTYYFSEVNILYFACGLLIIAILELYPCSFGKMSMHLGCRVSVETSCTRVSWGCGRRNSRGPFWNRNPPSKSKQHVQKTGTICPIILFCVPCNPPLTVAVPATPPHRRIGGAKLTWGRGGMVVSICVSILMGRFPFLTKTPRSNVSLFMGSVRNAIDCPFELYPWVAGEKTVYIVLFWGWAWGLFHVSKG